METMTILFALIGFYLVLSGIYAAITIKNPVAQLLNLSRKGTPLLYDQRINDRRIENPLTELL